MKCLLILAVACMLLHSCFGATIPTKLETMDAAAQGGARITHGSKGQASGVGEMQNSSKLGLNNTMNFLDHAWIEGPGKRSRRDADHAWAEGPGRAVNAVAKRAAGSISAKVGGRRRRAAVAGTVPSTSG
ncbi:hypothetical protein PRIPAC_79451 [Pristionchus pacificus]|uniref:Uncharacterized protein n=1 Tax=Pristionchus pacificus TaxID=54126 RepID=A0A2A6BXH3_PRIPA|nr:hypothetical protein PRIPAC_79451 [Pristionchus pacificus]|eukprot:PDM70614.1 hypothetical protein PRIPAC_46860 [Pristionchus pacificus]